MLDMPDERYCEAPDCWAVLPGSAKKYCSSACRQRAYRDRQQRARRAEEEERDGIDPKMAQAKLTTWLLYLLEPEQLETFNPGARRKIRRALERALEAL
jgi:hypothetical protein